MLLTNEWNSEYLLLFKNPTVEKIYTDEVTVNCYIIKLNVKK